MSSERRLSISVSEVEVGHGFLPERYYVHSFVLPVLGHVLLPEYFRATPFSDQVRIERYRDDLGTYVHFATLSTREFLRAALAGTFGLSWEPAEEVADADRG